MGRISKFWFEHPRCNCDVSRVWVIVSILIPFLLFGAMAAPVAAFKIELNGAAPLRIEWQRMFARGQMPLPNTPNVNKLGERLAARGLNKGAPIFVRVFKAESELEIWLLKGKQYVLFETYPICHWSGALGPKLEEGDKQNPEGFYAIRSRQLRHWGRWPKSIHINYPNRYDRALERTGSYILVHGGCSSVGCFAMTNPVMKEIHGLAKRAVRTGQYRFQFHIYPFRMTARNMAGQEHHKWYDFWRNLKQGYDNFERTKVPPKVSVCNKRYLIEDAGPDEIEELDSMERLSMVSLEDADENDRCVEPATAEANTKRHASSSANGKY